MGNFSLIVEEDRDYFVPIWHKQKGVEFMERKNKFYEINDNEKIDFEVPELLMHLMEDAEAADMRNDGSYDNLADTIDVWAKNFYADGVLSKSQWDKIARRYPQ